MVTLYALFAGDRAFLWNTMDRDDEVAYSKALEILRKEKIEKGSLFRGPTDKDEMEFIQLVY